MVDHYCLRSTWPIKGRVARSVKRHHGTFRIGQTRAKVVPDLRRWRRSVPELDYSISINRPPEVVFDYLDVLETTGSGGPMSSRWSRSAIRQIR